MLLNRMEFSPATLLTSLSLALVRLFQGLPQTQVLTWMVSCHLPVIPVE